MSLSQSVQESLDEASGALRNALFKASRSERPNTLTAITRLIHELDSISRTDELLDSLDNMIDRVKKDED